MGFPFNLHSIDWASNPAVPQWLAGLADDHPLVREEAAAELHEAFTTDGDVTPVAPLGVEPLLELVGAEGAKGRGLAAMVLANLGLCARTRTTPAADAVLDHLTAGRSSLELLTTRHAASTPLGAAIRALLTVIGTTAPGPQLADQLDVVAALVSDADAREEAPAPSATQLLEWLIQVKAGQGNALLLAQRAVKVDPRSALALLNADPTRPTTSVQRVHRALLQTMCLDALETGELIPAALAGPWNRTEQALLLDAAERCCVERPRVARALLGTVTDSTHSVRRRAVEVRVSHAEGEVEAAWKQADSLIGEWLLPAAPGAVNQTLQRGELQRLLALFPRAISAARVAQVAAAPTPDLALPEGDLL